ncbi:hypothetical protein SAMN04488030_2473 [Aliiroseovarius halocynthiae]|uniref:DUF5666 domain-containing protein n=1 Tax=Aliiroseovarius halocynthiae TaxID=985055 RepID=A0A545SQ94_9RHOB|nr:DUF5666 domain-containing protein [Aliiroseovarius halocynthiae]TQV67139.1 hypothetical protein FIL88_11190 [Aliiroseovarius halocynthiae]SMR82131.1 hypothetical protein SAMN04488030_2473 [Aliiroseovarius halocynthiae]
MSWLRTFLSAVLMLAVSTAAMATEEDEREGGILGTGILGTITALGSIYVNGQHIRFAPEFEVTDGVTVSTAAQLLPGHTVAVVAAPDGAGWQASYIRQITPLVGPVQSISDGQFDVLGTTIQAEPKLIAGLGQGDMVAISGLWQEGQVIASRIDRVANDSPARIEGSVFDVTPGQPLTIGGTEITGLWPTHIQDGHVVRVVGSANETGIQVQSLETGVFAATPQVILSEGYFSVPTVSGLYTLLGSDLLSYTDQPGMIDPVVRQLVCSRDGQMYPVQIDDSTLPSDMSACFAPPTQ